MYVRMIDVYMHVRTCICRITCIHVYIYRHTDVLTYDYVEREMEPVANNYHALALDVLIGVAIEKAEIPISDAR